jgi:hypothetical protein
MGFSVISKQPIFDTIELQTRPEKLNSRELVSKSQGAVSRMVSKNHFQKIPNRSKRFQAVPKFSM